MPSHGYARTVMIRYVMTEDLLFCLRELRPALRERWVTLLRSAPAVSPLAHPDALIHMMDWTLDVFFQNLNTRLERNLAAVFAAAPNVSKDAGVCAGGGAPCACGKNPFVVYFAAAECALLETALPLFGTSERIPQLGEIRSAMQIIANKEIRKFCTICRLDRQRHAQTEPAPEAVSAATT